MFKSKMGYKLKSGKEIHPTSFSSGALDSLAAVLNILGVNETEMEPEDLGSGTDFSNNSLFLSMNEGAKAIRYTYERKKEKCQSHSKAGKSITNGSYISNT